MSAPVRLDDPADPRLAGYRDLVGGTRPDAAGQRAGLFVAEGLHTLERLIGSAFPVVSVLVAEERWARVAPSVADLDAPVYVAPLDLLRAVAGFNVHRGVLALGRRVPEVAPAELLASVDRAAPVLVTEGINDHENLGSLFRNAAALGAAAVLADPATCDPLYRRCVRVSLGHVLRVPWTRVRPWPDGLGVLRATGRTVLALTPDPAARLIDAVVAEGPGPVAVLVGAEGPGLTEGAMAAADERVRVPVAEGTDSVNVATAAALALHRLWPAP